MAETQLKTITGGGTQSTTQSPQTAGQPAASGTRSASLQPGTETSLLTKSPDNSGVPLGGGQLTTVSLGARSTQSTPTATTTPAKPLVPERQVDPILITIPVCLAIIAVVMFWLTTRSVKSTTK